jgi:hypothetical protein
MTGFNFGIDRDFPFQGRAIPDFMIPLPLAEKMTSGLRKFLTNVAAVIRHPLGADAHAL